MKHVRPISRPCGLTPRTAATTATLFLEFFTNILDAVAQFFTGKESQPSD